MIQAIPAQAPGKRSDASPVIKNIMHALSVLAEPGQVVELRVLGLNGRRIDSGYFTDFEKLARAAASYNSRAEGIYVTLNPLHPALLARSSNRITEYAKTTSSDKDVAKRRWLFVDFDPVRPAGISSSEEEHVAAIARAKVCQAWLQTQGILSVLADSGNGAHLLILIDLPNTDESTALLKSVLAALSAKFSDAQVEVDTSTSNASRIIKLYGTLACKGDNVPERPHRHAAILDVPEVLDATNAEGLPQIAASIALSSQPQAARSAAEETHAGNKQAAAAHAPASNGKVAGGYDAHHPASDRKVLDEIKSRLDMVGYAEGKLGVSAVVQGGEYRLPGNQGFLINPAEGVWYHHGGQNGGDALDLVGYLLHGSGWSRKDPALFRIALLEAARVTGVLLPEPAPPARNKKQKQKREQAEAAPTPPVTSATDNASNADAQQNAPAWKPDLMDIAHAWKRMYADQLAWDANVPGWRRWTGTHWELIRDPDELDLLAVDVLRSVQIRITDIGKIDSVLRLARALCKRQFIPSERLVNFANGTLDLRTMTGHTHTPADNLTTCLPYNYEPTGIYGDILHFLGSTIPDKEAQRAYMTHVGLALTGDTTFHKALVLLGPPRSGKTTLLKLAQLTIGTRPGQFASTPLFSSESRGANSRATWLDQSPRLTCLDEFPEDAIRDDGEELFKSMTAHGGVPMWLKYRDERSFNVWTPKLMFATNNKMRYRDPSGALTRRLLIVHCPSGLPDEKLDSTLLDKFKPELGAFGAACIQLALEAQLSRAYPQSDAMRALLSDIEQNGDAVKLWLLENCIFEENAFTPTHILYQNFKWWCDDSGLHPVSRPKLRDMIYTYKQGVRPVKRRVTDTNSGEVRLLWGLVGVRLRTAADDRDE